jgi:predicted ester cyclase
MPASPTDVVRRFMRDVLNGANAASADELLDEAFTVHGLPPGVPADRRGLEMVGGMMRAAFPNWVDTEDELQADGDRVTVRFTGRGTHQGAFMGVPPTGRSVVVSGRATYRVVDGRITEDRLEVDMADVMRQLGVDASGDRAPAPGEG